MARLTIEQLRLRKARGEKLVLLTAYDYPFAHLLDEGAIDGILVGDSLAMVALGRDETSSVTMEEMLHHVKAVRRGVLRTWLIGDMPAAALDVAVEQTLEQAKRFCEAGCEAVKVEWRAGMDKTTAAIVKAGIAVMGHVGLTPQTAKQEGGFRLRGKDSEAAIRIIEQAESLEQAGCCAIVVECVPDEVAKILSNRLTIPTIGIGSGPNCDGQILVTQDLLGLYERIKPRFAKRYAQMASITRKAIADYATEVRGGLFPAPEHTQPMPSEELAKLQQKLAQKS